MVGMIEERGCVGMEKVKIDALLRSPLYPLTVIPAEAGSGREGGFKRPTQSSS
jgi:hypothetical protein